MNPLWNTWRCRRNANFFMLSLAGFFGLLIVIAIIHHNGLDRYAAPALPAIGLLLVVWTGQAIREARARHREQLQRPPLSRDELRVARSKLMNSRKVKSL
jgi:peptidoglycan/LPS O-acetylase OafA/YrhL